MRKSTFTEEQIAYALREAESGTPVPEVCRKLGISEQTFYRWKRKFAGMGIAELRRLRQLEEENRRLKQLVADLTLDRHMLARGHSKNEPCRGATPPRMKMAYTSRQRAARQRATAYWCASPSKNVLWVRPGPRNVATAGPRPLLHLVRWR